MIYTIHRRFAGMNHQLQNPLISIKVEWVMEKHNRNKVSRTDTSRGRHHNLDFALFGDNKLIGILSEIACLYSLYKLIL